MAGMVEGKFGTWVRQLTLTNSLSASYDEDGNSLQFRLEPAIGTHSEEEHRVNAPLAAIMYKVAMTLAERSGGSIEQQALVNECFFENGRRMERVLAVYPEQPLVFENLCLGFRTALMRGASQPGEEDEEPIDI